MIGIKISRRNAIAGLIVLTLIWIGNILYYNSHVLQRPVFLKHYYDIVNGMSSFELYYVDDNNSNTNVIELIFPELGPNPMYITNNLVRNDDRYYKMNSIIVTLDNGNINDVMHKQFMNKVITKAIVYLSDGRVFNVNIGKIYLYYNKPMQKVLPCARQILPSDSSGSSTFSTERDTKISGIYCRFPDIAEKVMNIDINDIALKDVKFPVEVEKGHDFAVGYSFMFNKNDERRDYEYNFPLYIKTDSTNTKKDYDTCYTNHYVQSANDVDIMRLKKEQGR